MDRPAIVIRDTHRYGTDLTVPEAIARLCGGHLVTVTVTDPAPPGGDPRGNPRHGSGITVRPAPDGQPEISWKAGTFETPGRAALFAEALALATRLASLAGLGGGQAVPGQAAAIGAAHGRDAARRALALATPAACHDITARLEAAGPMTCDLYAAPALGGEHGISYDIADLAGDLGLILDGDLNSALADDSVLRTAEEAYLTAVGEAFRAEAGRIARDRAAQHPGTSSQRGEP